MECRVVFADEELKKSFELLREKDERLYKEVLSALKTIKDDAFCGRNVKKKLIPKDLIKKYGINNLWIYNLRRDWRLLYAITNNEIEVLSIVLDWMNHKDYEKLFKFA